MPAHLDPIAAAAPRALSGPGLGPSDRCFGRRRSRTRPDAAAAFGIQTTPFVDGLRRGRRGARGDRLIGSPRCPIRSFGST